MYCFIYYIHAYVLRLQFPLSFFVGRGRTLDGLHTLGMVFDGWSRLSTLKTAQFLKNKKVKYSKIEKPLQMNVFQPFLDEICNIALFSSRFAPICVVFLLFSSIFSRVQSILCVFWCKVWSVLLGSPFECHSCACYFRFAMPEWTFPVSFTARLACANVAPTFLAYFSFLSTPQVKLIEAVYNRTL